MARAKRPKKGSQGRRDLVRQKEIFPRRRNFDFIGLKVGMASGRVSYMKRNPDPKRKPVYVEEIVPLTLLEVPKRYFIEAVNLYNGSKVTSIGSYENSTSTIYRTNPKDLSNIPQYNHLTFSVSVDFSSISALSAKNRQYFELPCNYSFEEAIPLISTYLEIPDLTQVDYLDTIGITKGKGFSGVVKRYGVKLLNKGSKKKRRAIANQGGKSPGYTRPTVGAAGQYGLQIRTNLSLQNLFISESDPSLSFESYGSLSEDTFLIGVRGSIAGVRKSIVLLRSALREKYIKPLDNFKFIGLYRK